MITRQDIIDKAREYLGTPFHHQGRLKGVGVDCVGLAVCVGRELGLTQHDLAVYKRIPDGKTLLEELRKAVMEKPKELARPGDLAVFWVQSPKRPTHVGILTDKGMVHSYFNVGGVVEHILGEYWESRLVAAFSYPGVI